MATPKPHGITAEHLGNGWNVVRWDALPGENVHYECQHEGESNVTKLREPETALLAIAPGTKRWTQIRNVVDGVESGWIKVTLNSDGKIVKIEGEDDPTPPPVVPPKPPENLRLVSSEIEQGIANVAWDKAADADYWEVLLENHYSNYRRADGPLYTFHDLTKGARYSWRVRAVRNVPGGTPLTSGPTRSEFTFGSDDPKPPPVVPDKPQNVRAHCITHQSTKIEWDRDPAVHEYEVWIDGQEEAAQRTQDTIVTILGLQQQKSYTARVVAYTLDGQKSEPGSVHFVTGKPEPDPDPDPETETKPEWQAPALTVWPVEGGKVRASWDDPALPQKPVADMGYPFWHVSLDQQTWFFTRERHHEFEVTQGGEVMVSVYGVWDNTLTAIATKGVAL